MTQSAHKVRVLPQGEKTNYAPFSLDTMCQALITVLPAHRGRNKPWDNRCRCLAKVRIDRKDLCIRHAQALALEILLKEGVKDGD